MSAVVRKLVPERIASVTDLRARLFRNGFRPVPVYNHDHPGESPGKRPLGDGWQNDARADLPICASSRALSHALNSGLLCDGLRAIDVDIDDAEVVNQMRELLARHLGATIERWRIDSVRPLFLYRAAEGEPRKRSVASRSGKIEVLGRGQQFVGFGFHPAAGAELQWRPRSPLDVRRDELPAVTEEQIEAFLTEAAALIGAAVPEADSGVRETNAELQADAARVEAWVRSIPNSGGADWDAWNNFGMALWNATSGSDHGRALFHDWSSANDAYDTAATDKRWKHYAKSPPSRIGAGTLHHLAQQARGSGAPAPDGEDYYAALADDPRLVRLPTPAPSAEAVEPATDVVVEIDGFALHEDGIACAFAAAYADELRFDHTRKSWFRWDGVSWRQDSTKLAFHWCREKCRDLALQPDLPARTVATLAKAATAAAVERFAQADPSFAVTSEAWDRDPWLLGTPGGVVDLRTGELRSARQADMITKLTSVAPALLGTSHPMFDVFLEEAAGVADADTEEDLQDARDLIAFLWRLFGYCLTGVVTEEILVFLYGEGGTGKGTLLRTIVSILGDYGVVVPIECFTANSRLNMEYYRARMAGARVVTASETEAGTLWAEAQIKEMTGNENALSARHPYGEPFDFVPQFTPILVGNHAPRLKGRSAAMVRRLRMLPFKHKPEEVDPGLKEKLEQEYPAILRSLIDGCVEWKRNGLGTAKVVEAESEEYFRQQDTFGRWLDERCLFDLGKSERPKRLRADYLDWLRENNEDLSSTSTEFKEMIERTRGLRYSETSGNSFVRGLELRITKTERDGMAARYGDDDR